MTEPVVRLAPLSCGDGLALAALRNDPEVQKHVRHPGLVTSDGQRRWWEWLVLHPEQARMFAIESNQGTPPTWLLVGCGGLTSIDWLNRRAELSVYTVPATHELEAARLLLRHAFKDLGLHRVEAETLTVSRDDLVVDLGFGKEGVRRHAYWRDGEFIAGRQWGLLSREWGES